MERAWQKGAPGGLTETGTGEIYVRVRYGGQKMRQGMTEMSRSRWNLTGEGLEGQSGERSVGQALGHEQPRRGDNETRACMFSR